MQEYNYLVLEIVIQDERLRMSLFEQKDITQTVRNYAECLFIPKEINKLSHEIASVLDKISKCEKPHPDLLHNFKKTGQLLWDQLLAKTVKDSLLSAQGSSLILAIDERLIYIPWELLYDGKDFLCLKFNLGRLVRAKEQGNVMRYRNVGSYLRMLVLADPTSDLRSAYLEGINIRNQLDQKRKEVKIDFKSTEIDTLYVKKNICDYDIVHFAGHCEYSGTDRRDSGWVLSDGKFTAQDIISLGESLSLPALIFSNACYSAQPNSEVVGGDYQEKTYSLAEAFLFAGVRLYMGTILTIGDEVSLVFAREFYNQLIKGKVIGECVRMGRLEMIEKYGLDSFFWSNYILYGDPNFAFFGSTAVTSAEKSRIRINKALLKRLFSLIVAICLSVYLYLWLPSLRPDSYFLFIRAQRLFDKGMNEEVISSCRTIVGKDPAFLTAYPLLAEAYKRTGKRQEAMRYYLDYALYSEKRQDKKNLASAYVGIGWLYHDQADYAKAFDFYNKAVLLSRQNRDMLNQALALRRLAVWYIDKEDNDKALELLLKSSEINRSREKTPKHRYNLACDYFDLGLVFTNKNDLITAKEFYQKSQRIFQSLRMKRELSDYYFNLGEIYLFEKDYHRSLVCYMHGLKIDESQGNKPSMASDYNMVGELYVEMGNLEEAEKSFLKSISICKEIGARPELAQSCTNLAYLYKQKRRFNKAREYFRQAQEIYWQIDATSYQKIREALLDLDNPS